MYTCKNCGAVLKIPEDSRIVTCEYCSTQQLLPDWNHQYHTNHTELDSLLKRAFMFLEDGEWERADEYFEKALDVDPECVKAYLGKLMQSLHIRNQEDLEFCDKPFDDNKYFCKLLLYADEDLKAILIGYVESIKERNNHARCDVVYADAKKIMLSATDIQAYRKAADLFDSVGEYKDASGLARECREKVRELESQEKEIAEEKRLKAERTVQTLKNVAKAASILAAVTLVVVILINTVILPYCQYRKALNLMDQGAYSMAITEFESLGDYKDSEKKIAQCQAAMVEDTYCYAVSLLETEDYDRALQYFQKIVGYKDTSEKMAECEAGITEAQYQEAVSLMNSKQYSSAITLFRDLGDYKDSVQMIDNCEAFALEDKYSKALSLMDAQEYESALELFNEVADYKNGADLIAQCKTKLKQQRFQEALKDTEIGQKIRFGIYEQDAVTHNGKEDIVWIVKDVRDGKALLVSEKALDYQLYNNTEEAVTWETCTLRQWLNEEFYNTAFTNEEKPYIAKTTVSADPNPKFDTDPGNATQDNVFLLSVSEAAAYFRSDNELECQPTDYAVAHGADKAKRGSGTGNCWWWLRTPGESEYDAAYVGVNTGIYMRGTAVNSTLVGHAVRPALWIDLGE